MLPNPPSSPALLLSVLHTLEPVASLLTAACLPLPFGRICWICLPFCCWLPPINNKVKADLLWMPPWMSLLLNPNVCFYKCCTWTRIYTDISYSNGLHPGNAILTLYLDYKQWEKILFTYSHSYSINLAWWRITSLPTQQSAKKTLHSTTSPNIHILHAEPNIW